MPTPHSPSIPTPTPLQPSTVNPTIAQRSWLRYYRPDRVKAPTLPMGAKKDRFAGWFEHEENLLPPAVQTWPTRWEMGFPSQLRNWRERSDNLRRIASIMRWTHGMIPGLTWCFPVLIPEGEAVHLDASLAQTTICPARQRLVLVCMPPLVILQEGQRIAVSDPRDLERPPQASRMPQEVLTVPAGPRLLLDHELDSLAWAASEDREALVGELLEE